MKRGNVRTRWRVGLLGVVALCAISPGASARAQEAGSVRWETTIDASRCDGTFVSCTATWSGRKTTGGMKAAAALTPTTPPSSEAAAYGLGALAARPALQTADQVTVTARFRIVHAEAVRTGEGLTQADVSVALWTKTASCHPDATGRVDWCDQTAVALIADEFDVPGARDGELVELTTTLRDTYDGDRLLIEPILQASVRPPSVTTPSCEGNFFPAGGGGLCDKTATGVVDVPARAYGEVIVESVTLTYG